MSIANVNVCEWEGGDLNCVYVRDKGGGEEDSDWQNCSWSVTRVTNA